MPVLAALAALAAAAPAAGQGVGEWTEAVVSVRDPESAATLFRVAGGWRPVARGAVSRDELDYWRLPRTASARFLKLCAPSTAAGCIRFVRFSGVAQRRIRLAARPWDTGGIFSIMLRSTDVRGTFARALDLGWWAETEPYHFTFGGSDLYNVVLTNTQGFNIALYERVTPPFTEYPLTSVSRGFNSMRMVRDQRASVAFYTKLGFSKAFDADYVDPAPTLTNFSVPVNYANRIVRRAAAMHPVPGDGGRVELMQFVGFEGKDESANASPPNLGIVSLRFPVRNLRSFRAAIAARGVATAYAAAQVRITGLGTVDLIAVRDPDGNLTEFYQTAAPPR